MPKDVLYDVFDPTFFQERGKHLISELTTYIRETTSDSTAKVLDFQDPETELAYWKDFLDNGDSSDFFKEVLQHSTHIHNPKYIAHQVGITAPITALTSTISALLNNGTAIYEMGMASNAMERIVTEKLCTKIGYTSNATGFLTSGGTLANLTALLTARKIKIAHDVWNEGHKDPLGIMVCEEAHYCVDRAARIMGLGSKGILKVPAAANYGMDIKKMETVYQEAQAKGIQVFAIVGSAPSTATGAHDDLKAIASFAKKHKLWFHVDAAHGGAALFSKTYASLLDGIDQADSVVIDGHKMMFMPTITTALLYRDKAHAESTFSLNAEYLLRTTNEDEWFNSGKRTFECTKTMMGLHWYILFKMYGEAVFDAYVTRQYNLARAFAAVLKQDSYFELATEPMTNILCFRYIDKTIPEREWDKLNQKIRESLLNEGTYYIVQTKLREKHYLRTTLMNPFTTIAHLKELLLKIKTLTLKFNQ